MLLFLGMLGSDADKDKFVRIYEKYRYFLWYLANERLQDVHLAEDAVQETFLALTRHMDKVGEVEKYDGETDTWEIVPDVTDFAYEDIAYLVEPGEVTEETVTADWSEKYAAMDAGTYRIAKTVAVTDTSGETAEHILTAEFVVD